MVEVICDTNFLIHLATNRIINIDRLDVEIGQITFVVPQVVVNELIALSSDLSKKDNVNSTLEYIKNFKKIPMIKKWLIFKSNPFTETSLSLVNNWFFSKNFAIYFFV